MAVSTTTPEYLTGLLDDAAIFPPGEAPLPAAIRAHAEHRTSVRADVVGPFVVDTARLQPALAQLSTMWQRDEPLPLAVVTVPDSVDDVVRLSAGPATHLVALEVKVPEPDAEGVARLAEDLRTLVSPGGAEVFVELPRPGDAPPPDWHRALDALAAEGLMLKLRTGGVRSEMFPSEHELAACLTAAIERGIPFKCTAGLHNALRHRDTTTGAEHHGFLNVLAATRRAMGGATTEEVRELLATTDAATLVAEVHAAGPAGLATARQRFRSFGTCSITEPLEDLIKLDLLDETILETA